MAIEEIDMSIPVTGALQQEQQPTRAEAPGDGLFLAAGVRRAVRASRRFALTRRGRAKRAHALDREIKQLTKRVAAQAAGQIENRQLRADVRIHVYRAVTSMVGVLVEEQLGDRRRARSRQRWLVGALLACLVVLGVLLRGSGAAF